MTGTGRFLYVWGPFLTYCVLIFALSSFSRIPAADNLPDKWLHYFEYSFFAVLLWRAIGDGRFRKLRWKEILVLFCTGTAFGGAEELYQSLIPGRDPSLGDWAADVAGILSMITLMMIRPRGMMQKDEA